MLYWRNRPIDQLSKTEMRLALKEMAGELLEPTPIQPATLVYQAFLAGIATGLAIALAGVFFGSFL